MKALDDDEYKNMLDTLALCLGVEPKNLKPSLLIQEIGISRPQLMVRLHNSFGLNIDPSETFTSVGDVERYLQRVMEGR